MKFQPDLMAGGLNVHQNHVAHFHSLSSRDVWYGPPRVWPPHTLTPCAGFKPPTGMPTVFDPSYAGVGQKVGLEIWRVEKLAVVKKPANDKCYQGNFYTGDSYIILQTKVGCFIGIVKVD